MPSWQTRRYVKSIWGTRFGYKTIKVSGMLQDDMSQSGLDNSLTKRIR